jgi:hypothetical protein
MNKLVLRALSPAVEPGEESSYEFQTVDGPEER